MSIVVDDFLREQFLYKDIKIEGYDMMTQEMADLEKFEKSLTKQEKKDMKRTTVQDMIQCPYCKCMSYPRIYENPLTEDEKNAIICGSCLRDLKPYMDMAEDFEKRMEVLWDKEDEYPELFDEMINDSGVKEKYLNAEKVMLKVIEDYQRKRNLPKEERIVNT